jgi:hypothetical protein
VNLAESLWTVFSLPDFYFLILTLFRVRLSMAATHSSQEESRNRETGMLCSSINKASASLAFVSKSVSSLGLSLHSRSLKPGGAYQ